MTTSSTSSGTTSERDSEVRRERAEMATCCHGNGDKGRSWRVRMEEREGSRSEGAIWPVRICKTQSFEKCASG